MAARNVLVGEGEKCKVTDFGMARNVQQDDIYTKQSRVSVFMELQFYHLYKLYLNAIFLFCSFSVKRVVSLLSGLLMKLCCTEHTQPKVTCEYYKTYDKLHCFERVQILLFWETQSYFIDYYRVFS